ncbi:XisI protein [Nostoc sp. CENA543]|uniref:XisI protein n=1 Tax=Nostoc sp. CENA543 TaxID=1869241 RepID=UPI000CA20016|nr:XisI protein [Nostoc sp. CENA543]AUT03578.1 XisI protein [Nostoc sp. CENA543]
MDTNTNYQNIVKQVMQKYARLRPSHGEIRLETVFDDVQSRYALMQVGWDRGRRVRGNLIYATIQDGKVWIEYDGIETGITQDLINQGIPEGDIVLAFLQQQAVTSR